MARFVSRFAAAAAFASTLGMVTTPAMAAQLPLPQPDRAPVAAAKGWSVDGETAQRHRGGWGRGWGGGGYGRHHWHRGGVDTGDVLAGVLIIGGIAAIASAASNRDRHRGETDRNGYPYRTDRDHDRDAQYRNNDRADGGLDSRGLDRAADMCVSEIERSQPVDRVDSVDRTGSGWRVQGGLRNGRSFSCAIGNDGRVGAVDLDARISAIGNGQPSVGSGQWDDDAYARARSESDSDRDSDRDTGG